MSGFLSGEEPELQTPSWADDLDLEFQDVSVAIKFREKASHKIPLFGGGNLSDLGNWKDKNPLDRACSVPKPSDRDLTDCRDFFIAAVRVCGNTVENRLLGVIKETEQPKFDICGQPNGDVFAEERAMPVIGVSEICRISVAENALLDRLGLPKLSHVQILLRTPSTSKAGPRGSFHSQDAALVEKMKGLIDNGTASNVLGAATMASPQALRRKDTKEENVVRRLQERFSNKYPNYSNLGGP